jgi:HSP20 family protein
MTMLDLIPWKRSEKTPARREEMDPFLRLRDQMNQLFDGFFDDPWSLHPFETFDSNYSAFMPRLEMTETDADVKVSVELPGMDEKDVQVSLENQVLTISGEKKSESKDKGEGYFRSERTYGMFRRQLTLPEGVNEDDVNAVFKNGVLSVTFPKRQVVNAAAKKISIKRG